MKSITAEAFREIMSSEKNNPSVDCIDVCTRMEYQQHHIEGVRNIPLDELMEHLPEFKDKQTLYIHCFSGSRSLVAINLLKSSGILADLVNVDGGILAWHRAGFPLTAE